jgi:RNA polymerase sigma-70 factor, ECF subfamily
VSDRAVTQKTAIACNLSESGQVGGDETMSASNPSRIRDHFPQRILAVTPRIRSFLRRLCGRVDDVDDLVQDVMERAIRYRHAFDPAAGSLENWLMKTAFRTYLNHRERTARQPRSGGDAIATAKAPEAHAAELRDQVGFALRQLTPVEQDIVLRFHHRHETIVEIGAALGMPEGTVKSHLHRARRKIAAAGDSES